MFFKTKNAIATQVSNSDGNLRCYWVMVNGQMAGAFLVSIDEVKYNNICVMDYAFRIKDDEELEKEIFKEIFSELSKRKQMPVYFKTDTLTDETKKLLMEIGAKETVDADEKTIWFREENCPVFKLG